MDLGRATSKLLVSKTGNALLAFGGVVLFARWLGPEAFGTYFLFVALLGLISIPADLGVRGALEKRLSEGSNRPAILGSALAFKLVTLSLVSLAVLAASDPIDAYLGEELALLLVAALVVKEFAMFYVQAVRGEMRVGATASIQFARRFVWATLGAALVATGHGLYGLIAALICGRLVEFAWAFWRCDTGVGRPSMDRVRSLFSFSKYQTINAVGGRIYQWLDLVVVGYFLLPSDVGAYEVAWQVTLVVLLVSRSIGVALFPQISRWNTESSLREIEVTVTRALEFALFVSFPAIVGALLYSREVLHYLYGPAYAVAALVVVVLMVERLFQSFNTILFETLRGIDRPDLAAKATVFAVGLNLVLNPILVVWIGLVGAAIATCVVWAGSAVLSKLYLSRHVAFEVPYRIFGWYTVAALVMAVMLYAVKSFFPVTGIVVLFAQVALGAAVYLGVSVAIPAVRTRVLLPGFRALQ